MCSLSTQSIYMFRTSSKIENDYFSKRDRNGSFVCFLCGTNWGLLLRVFLSRDWTLQSGRHYRSLCNNDVRSAAGSTAIKIQFVVLYFGERQAVLMVLHNVTFLHSFSLNEISVRAL